MAPLFQHLLVPLDFTEKNAAALLVAINLAKQNDASVTLLHVIEEIGYADDLEIQDFYNSLKQRAEQELIQHSDAFKQAGIPVILEVSVGKTASTIVRHTMQENVDVVVLSSHKITSDEMPRSWATLSYQISILCQCPVMLVK